MMKGKALQQEQYCCATPRTVGVESPPVESQSRGSTTSKRTMQIGKVDFPKFGGEDLQG